MLLSGDLDSSDYKAIKQESEGKLEILEARLADAISNYKPMDDIRPVLGTANSRLTQLDVLYYKSTTCDKRELIGSMYPQKITFEELQHRTAKVGDLYSCIYLINSKLKVKERQATDFSCLPTVALQTGLEPLI